MFYYALKNEDGYFTFFLKKKKGFILRAKSLIFQKCKKKSFVIFAFFSMKPSIAYFSSQTHLLSSHWILVNATVSGQVHGVHQVLWAFPHLLYLDLTVCLARAFFLRPQYRINRQVPLQAPTLTEV